MSETKTATAPTPGPRMKLQPRALSERHAAAYIGMSAAFLAAARIGRGTPGPSFIRIGRTVRYLVEDLDRWLLDRRIEAGRRSA